MIETIAGTAPTRTRHTGRRLSPEEWSYQRHSGRQIWSCRRPDKPEGVSTVILSETPTGDRYVTVEGNLTAALHGSRCAVGSLRREELHPARDRLFAAAADWSGLALPDPQDFGLGRVDPSATYRLVDGLTASQVVLAYAEAFQHLATGRAVSQQTNGTRGATALLRITKARSWQVYDKGAEARGRGIELGPALRCEPRIRPNRIDSGHWKGVTGTMAIEAAVVDASDKELREMLAAVAQINGATAMALVEALMKGGATPNEAFRLVGAGMVADGSGWDSVEALGVNPRSARRWRDDLRRYLTAAGVQLEDLAGSVSDYLGAPIYADEVAAAERLSDDESDGTV